MDEFATPDEAIELALQVGAQGISLGLAKRLQAERNDLKSENARLKSELKESEEPRCDFGGVGHCGCEVDQPGSICGLHYPLVHKTKILEATVEKYRKVVEAAKQGRCLNDPDGIMSRALSALAGDTTKQEKS